MMSSRAVAVTDASFTPPLRHSVGGIVGNMIAPGIGGAIGFMAGTLLGNLLDPPKIEGPRLNDLKLQTSEYGRPIPILYGTMRMSGNCIWPRQFGCQT